MINQNQKNQQQKQLKYLFEPNSVAIIGASNDVTKIGYSIIRNIIIGGYKGNIYPINPKGGNILGLKVFKNILDIPDSIDIAIIAIPAKYVCKTVKNCSGKHIKYLIIITSGFSEIGNNSEEQEIVNIAHKNNIRVLGPNIFGIYSSKSSLNATFGPTHIIPGNVGLITQSGALGLAMIGKTAAEKIGLSTIVSMGNKADLDETDILEYLTYMPETRIIMIYIEGVKNGKQLIHILKKATKKKPIVIIKSGRSERGAIAAASHTGSLAGSDKVFDDIMKQCGVLRAENIDEAFNWCKDLVNIPLPIGEKSIIITNGGGIGVLAADACEKYEIKLLDDNNHLSNIFANIIPDFGSTQNPIDITGQAKSIDYNLVFNIALNDPYISSVIGLYCETAVFDSENLYNMVQNTYQQFLKRGKPIVFSLFGGENIENIISSLSKKGIPIYSDVYKSVSSLGAIYKYYRYLINDSIILHKKNINILEKKNKKIDIILSNVRLQQRNFLLVHEAHTIMSIIGINMPQSFTVHNIKEATIAADSIGYPVVMKIVSSEIIHKSDIGGVILNLENRNEIIDAYQVIIHNCHTYFPNATIEGIEITEMVFGGNEIIIGAHRDRIFGPIIMIGLGGIYVEVLKDIAFRSFPSDKHEIMNMIKETKSYTILLGIRGKKNCDIESLINNIIKIGQLIIDYHEITDIEINPLIIYEKGLGSKAVDARILLDK